MLYCLFEVTSQVTRVIIALKMKVMFGSCRGLTACKKYSCKTPPLLQLILKTFDSRLSLYNFFIIIS